jgi:hypothetical protein
MNLETNNNVISMEELISSMRKNLYKVPLNFQESKVVTDMVMQKNHESLLLFLMKKGYSLENISNGEFESK